MALVWFDGFESGLVLNGRWLAPANVSVSPGNARTGNGYMGVSSAGNPVQFKFLTDDHATVGCGAAIKIRNVSTSNLAIFTFMGDNAATSHVTFCWDGSTGVFTARRGSASGAILASSSPFFGFDPEGYNFFEAKVVLSDTVGTVDFYVNNSKVLTGTGLDTKNGGTNATIDTIDFSRPFSGVNTRLMDDFYAFNGAGGGITDVIGDIKIERLVPNGNGNSSGLTGSDGNSVNNYLQVDETGVPTDSDYNGLVTVGNKDTYTMTDLSSTNVTVYGAILHTRAAKSDAGAKSGRRVLRSAGTDYTGSDLVLSTSYTSYGELLLTDPATGVAWTPSGINAVEQGFEVRT